LTDLKDKTIEQEVGSLSIRKEEEEAASEDEKNFWINLITQKKRLIFARR